MEIFNQISEILDGPSFEAMARRSVIMKMNAFINDWLHHFLDLFIYYQNRNAIMPVSSNTLCEFMI